ncbi:hypothetical protein M0P48_04535 [Candidatus Gracilibacteria bacterium]|nr:hypothetical protein [Candidatus Gracilibacteria bacterium]
MSYQKNIMGLDDPTKTEEEEEEESGMDIKEVEKSLFEIVGIQRIKIIRQPAKNQSVKTIGVNLHGIGIYPLQIQIGDKDSFIVRITFTDERSLQKAKIDLGGNSFFDKIMISKQDPLVLGARMTTECAQSLYDYDPAYGIDMALIEKYGGANAMKRYLYYFLLRERTITIPTLPLQ